MSFDNVDYSMIIETENWLTNYEIGSNLIMQPMVDNGIGSTSTMQLMANNKIGPNWTMLPIINNGIGSSSTMQHMDQYLFIYNVYTHNMPCGFL